jgi:hypothetical protein
MSNKPNRETVSFGRNNPTPAPHTPWGPAQLATTYGEGVMFYSTAGHGGFHLSPERLATMPKPLDAVGTFAGPGWYEEDCDSALVIIAFPDLFSDSELYNAALMLLGGMRPIYMDGVETWLETPAAKPIVARVDAFYAANKDKFRLAGAMTKGDGWTVRAVSLNKERVLTLEIKEYPVFDGPFTREEIEAKGATIMLDKRKDEVAA